MEKINHLSCQLGFETPPASEVNATRQAAGALHGADRHHGTYAGADGACDRDHAGGRAMVIALSL